MTGKILTIVIAVSAIVAGAAMYYLQVYGFYSEVAEEDVRLTTLASGMPETIPFDDFQAIDADSSPLRYRACFATPLSLATLNETFAPYEGAVPLTSPGWFDCFDAPAIGAALETGDALAFMGTENVTYGFDRVVAVTRDGQGFVWHQINRCGEEVFDGNPPPEGCPPPPERTN